MKAVYQFHPDFAGSVNVWWGDPEQDWGLATLEGGDVMPVGNGIVLIGMSERSSRQAITQLAAALFAAGAADRVIVAGMPKLRAAMHLDTVFTFADLDCATVFSGIVDGIQTFTLRPADSGSRVEAIEETRTFVDVVADALGIDELRIIHRRRRLRHRAPAVGQRQQPRRDRARSRRRLRPQHPHQLAPAQGRHRGHHDRRRRARQRPRRRPLHDLPTHPRSAPRLTQQPSNAHLSPRDTTPPPSCQRTAPVLLLSRLMRSSAPTPTRRLHGRVEEPA